jgi:hypothetical protein
MLPSIVIIALLTLTLVQAVAAEDVERAEPWEFRSHWGWYDGDRISYYDLGRSTNQTAPAFRLVDGAGDPVQGQDLIFGDLRPGVIIGVPPSVNYSDFHRIWDVQVPGGYVPNTLRSYTDLVDADLPMTERDLVWNTPMVPADSVLVGPDLDLHPLLEGWWENVSVHYFRFESSQDTPGLFDPASGLVRDSSTMAVFDPPGQLDILDTYPGQATHSPLSRLYIFNPISTEFVADSVRTWTEAESLGFPIFPDGGLYNHPVVGGREEIPRFDHADPAVYDLKEAWSGETSKVLYYDMGPMTEGEVDIYRFVTAQGAPIIAQHYLVETVAPGMLLGDVDTEGYYVTWRFNDIIVEDEGSFEPDVIKSMEDVRAMGFVIIQTDEYMVAPMVTKNASFKPQPSNPPGEGLDLVWYQGADVYLNIIDPTGLAFESRDAGMPQVNGPVYMFNNVTAVLGPDGQPYAGDRPILHVLPEDSANYSVIWSVVHASGGDGYRPGRFRTGAQLDQRGWSLSESGDRILAGFVAGPINVPAWKPERFTFVVGPVINEDDERLKGVDVRVSRGIDVVQGRTDSDGLVAFEVDSSWNGETIQTFLSKDGYLSSDHPAEIVDYEHYRPLGGYVPPMVSVDEGNGLDSAVGYALVALVIVVLFVMILLLKGRSDVEPSITDEEADEILSHEETDDEVLEVEDSLSLEDVEDLGEGPERLT